MYAVKLTDEAMASANTRLENAKFSHADTHRVKEGWKMGMYEKEVTNYDGNGPCLTVYGNTPEEAEAMAIIVVRALRGEKTENGGKFEGNGNHY